jgi:CDP-diacylglycerol--glycerol-3-phosphate 3-phosphatidyltransferase
LTALRIALIPLLALIYQLKIPNYHEIATLIFFIASVTDFLDGYLARKYNVVSQFGQFFDPVADKLLVIVSLLILSVSYQSVWITIASVIIISREVLMSSFREWIAKSKTQSTIDVSIIGKWKTTFQMFAIGGLLWEANVLIISISYILLLLATLLTLYSFLLYVKKFSYTFADF